MSIHPEMFNKAVKVAHLLIGQKVAPGDTVVDATMGNGNDTLFLARCVGPSGKVYAFDIQPQAWAKTAARLQENGAAANVELIRDGHENMDRHVPAGVRLVLFNLGYLPGGDKTCYTQVSTTISALSRGLSLLALHGLALVAIYPGHDEGAREREAVLLFARQLPVQKYNAFFFDLINHVNDPPVLVGIERSA